MLYTLAQCQSGQAPARRGVADNACILLRARCQHAEVLNAVHDGDHFILDPTDWESGVSSPRSYPLPRFGESRLCTVGKVHDTSQAQNVGDKGRKAGAEAQKVRGKRENVRRERRS
jgi:hypothetical protein